MKKVCNTSNKKILKTKISSYGITWWINYHLSTLFPQALISQLLILGFSIFVI